MTGSSPPLVVLQSVSAPDGSTRYIDQLVEGLPSAVTLRFFSWRVALVGQYDVFHVHWPEYLLRNRNPLKAVVQKLLILILLGRLSYRRIPIVRTLHNIAPHEPRGVVERSLLRLIDRRTSLFVRLNEYTPIPRATAAVTVLHGHYRDRFAGMPRDAVVPGRLLTFGLIKPYKGVEALIGLFSGASAAPANLRIVGQPSNSNIRESIERLASDDPRVSLVLEFVDDERLVAEISAAALVVLPYQEMGNSGAVLLALSLDRPVLVPDSPVNRLLADEIGSEWVQLYHAPLTSEALTSALTASRPTQQRPELSGRDWKTLGDRYAAAYRQAIAVAKH